MTLREDLVALAARAAALAPIHCTDCVGYHGAWPTLRLTEAIGGIDADRETLVPLLAGLAREHARHRWLIAGMSDTGALRSQRPPSARRGTRRKEEDRDGQRLENQRHRQHQKEADAAANAGKHTGDKPKRNAVAARYPFGGLNRGAASKAERLGKTGAQRAGNGTIGYPALSGRRTTRTGTLALTSTSAA